MEEYQTEQVWKSFDIFSERPSSSEEPEGWMGNMSRFVEGSNPDCETLLSLVVRFEKQFPQMKNGVGLGFFETVRGDIQLVPSNNDMMLF